MREAGLLLPACLDTEVAAFRDRSLAGQAFRYLFLDATYCKARVDHRVVSKAVRLVREHAGDYPTQWAAIRAVSGRLGMSTETLRKWLRQAEVDEGAAPGVTSAESAEIRELRRKNRELEQTIEILKAATSFFARECDPRLR